MNHKIKLRIYQDRQPDSNTFHYHIDLTFIHKRFQLRFMTPEKLSLPEATKRVIIMAAEMDAETDGFLIANKNKELND